VPSEELEALRDLIRPREDARPATVSTRPRPCPRDGEGAIGLTFCKLG
jgi:hypothetical protein